METTQKTYQEVIEFYNVASQFLKRYPEDNKFRYAVNRTIKSAARIMADYQDRVEEINIKHCLAADDGKGEILRDQNNQYKFTKDGMIARNQERKKLFESPVKLDVHYATEVPKELDPSDRDSFIGFVIREEKSK